MILSPDNVNVNTAPSLGDTVHLTIRETSPAGRDDNIALIPSTSTSFKLIPFIRRSCCPQRRSVPPNNPSGSTDVIMNNNDVLSFAFLQVKPSLVLDDGFVAFIDRIGMATISTSTHLPTQAKK